MKSDPVPTNDMRLVPMPGLRGLLLFFFIAIAAAEVGLAVAVAEAWRTGVLGRPSRAATLAEAVHRLAVLESIFVLGAVASLVLWLLVMIVNTARVTPRHSMENRMSVRGLFLAALVMMIALVMRARHLLHEDVSDTIAVCAMMWAPFALINGSALRLATSQIAVRWWYAMLCGSLVIHQYFTSRLDLTAEFEASRVGRTALLHGSSALLMGLASLFAADSTGSLRDAVADKVNRYQHLVHDAARSRSSHHVGPKVAPGV